MIDNLRVECNSGWKSLYQPLIDYIKEYNKEHKPNSYFEIHQITGKHAGLRFYWAGYNVPTDIAQQFQEMVHAAEVRSYHVCELCGSEENVGRACCYGVDSTICENCLKEKCERSDREYEWVCDGKTYIVNKNGKIKNVK